MIDHTGIGVSSIEKCAPFYDAVLSALNMRRTHELTENGKVTAIGYGYDFPIFWIDIYHPHSQKHHTGFRAKSQEEVGKFYENGIKAGGIDNGKPGPRPNQSTEIYYAAFLIDPDGNNIEAVFRGEHVKSTCHEGVIKIEMGNFKKT